MGKVLRNILSSHTKIEHWANIFTPGIKILTRGSTKYDIFGNKVIWDHNFAAIFYIMDTPLVSPPSRLSNRMSVFMAV